ncbi:uncharacterized protein LOC122665656 [Telopea speciosissima]|uniref:uncharacterized protein LOC122665656 n=1 Tax=Telopea speciosissima TaxID=54955 RepID=UPI001CC7A590|nr:uncharacterized protein LOC122665656 [Telopea speciosissima]
MKGLFWNIKGVANRRARVAIRLLVREHRPMFLCIAEPKIRPEKCPVGFFSSLGYCREFIRNERASGAPNLWFFWREGVTRPMVLVSTEQHISMSLEVHGIRCFILVVHAHCRRVQGQQLWCDLCSIAGSGLPWLVLGDFNVYLLSSEKRGPGRFSVGSVEDFAAFIESAALVPLHSTGRKFTWSNNKRSGNVRAVLDRGLCNEEWLESFPGSAQQVLVSGYSDHAPLLVDCNDVPRPQNVPFSDESVLDRACRFSGGGESFVGGASEGNAHVYCGAEIKKAEEPASGGFEEITARRDYEAAVGLQEKLWAEKLREKWLKHGDRCFKFFHLSTKLHRAKSLIRELHTDAGVVVTDSMLIGQQVVSHFESFHKKGVSVQHDQLLYVIPTLISPADNEVLVVVPSTGEIRQAVMDLDPSSAPGPDGFLGAFFRVENARKVGQFRPICLGNFFFKVIPKILASRLAPLLPKLTSEEQGAFQKGKIIFSNIGVASELTNMMKAKSFGESLGLKLDVQKAYDTLEWQFLFDVLEKFGFHAKWIYWIHQILDSTRLSILINGGQVQPYQQQRIIELSWASPVQDEVKLNIDGCSLGNPGRTGAGGVLCDHEGNPMRCFASYAGVGSNFYAEFEVFFVGIHHAMSLHVENLWVECDSLAVVSCITEQGIPWIFQQRWWHYKRYLDSITWKVTHCFREVNTVADRLANHVASTSSSNVWESPPSFIMSEITREALKRPRYRFL